MLDLAGAAKLLVGGFVATLVMSGCGRSPTRQRIEPTYDRSTGRLTLLKYDSDGDGKVDTWSEMDGSRVLRIAIDTNGDGRIDRWEYYGADQKIERVGFSVGGDGTEDAWSFPGRDGSLARIELDTRHDGRISRVEYYEMNVLVRAEEDSDGDGMIDKWETYTGGRLASVAFDTARRGTPDRRVIYGIDGGARVEAMPQDGVASSGPTLRPGTLATATNASTVARHRLH